MTIRWLFVFILFLMLLPIAVFLRSAHSAPTPEKAKIYVVTVCKKPVAFLAIHKGDVYFSTVAQIEENEEFAKKLALMFAHADIHTNETAASAGIGCPRIVSL